MLNKDIKIAAYLNYFIYRFKPYYRKIFQIHN